MIGKYKHSIDAKGRTFMPARFRADMGTDIVVAMNINGKCLSVYSIENWHKYEEKLHTLPEIEMDDGYFWLYGTASQVEVDSQGRFAIDGDLRKLAGLEKDIISVGRGDRIEIWDEKAFGERMESIDLGKLREALMKRGF